MFQGDVIGLLNIANKDGGYTDSDRETLDRIAERIAPVLYAWIQRKLREEERKAARTEVEQLALQRQLALDGAKLGWWQFHIRESEGLIEIQVTDSDGGTIWSRFMPVAVSSSASDYSASRSVLTPLAAG